MDMTALQPDPETERILRHIMSDFAPDDLERPWTGGEVRMPVKSEEFPVPELARAALAWVGFVDQRWDEKTAWRVGGVFCNTNVSFALTKFGLKFMAETDHALAPLEDPARPPVKLPPGVTTSTRVDMAQEPDLVTLFHDFMAALRKAARVFDRRVLSRLVDDQVTAGNVTLLNQSGRLRGAHEFFRWQAQAFIDGHGDPEIRQDMLTIAQLAAGGTRGQSSFVLPWFADTNVGFCLNAMSTAYFSWLEHILVLALPFTSWEPADRRVTDLIGDSWADKWRYVIGSDTPDAKKTLETLTKAAEQFRNLDAHGGFGKKEQSLLVHTPIGALPARLTEGADAIRASVISEAPGTFPEACAVFDEVDTFLRTGPLRLAMTWIDGGMQVPFNEAQRQAVRDAMAESDDAYMDVLEQFSLLEDRLTNFEG